MKVKNVTIKAKYLQGKYLKPEINRLRALGWEVLNETGSYPNYHATLYKPSIASGTLFK